LTVITCQAIINLFYLLRIFSQPDFLILLPQA
jgi:hypothetical protein